MSENDADISENESFYEGSVQSVPTPKRTLPQLTFSPSRKLENISSTESQTSDSYSQSVESSKKGSKFCLNEDKQTQKTFPKMSIQSTKCDEDEKIQINVNEKNETTRLEETEHLDSKVVHSPYVQCSPKNKSVSDENCEVLNKKYLDSLKFTSPLAQSSPKVAPTNANFENLMSPITVPNNSSINVSIPNSSINVSIPNSSSTLSSLLSSSGSTKTVVTGVASCFTDMVASTFFKQSTLNSLSPKLDLVEKIRPFLEHLSKSDSSSASESTQNNYEDDNEGDCINNYYCSSKEVKESVLFENNISTTSTVPGKENSHIVNHQDLLLNVETNVLKIYEKSGQDDKETQFNNGNASQTVESSFQKESDICASSFSVHKKTHKWVKEVLMSSGEEDLTSHFKDSTLESVEERDNISPSAVMTAQDSNVVQNVRHPQVLWHESDNFVWIEIKIPGLEKSKYTFTSDYMSIEFSTNVNNVRYDVNLNLKGGHNIATAQHYPTPSHVQIKLEKLVKGNRYYWHQLTDDNEKPNWIKFNAAKAYETLEDTEDEDLKRQALMLPNGNECMTDTESLTSEQSDFANSEISFD